MQSQPAVSKFVADELNNCTEVPAAMAQLAEWSRQRQNKMVKAAAAAAKPKQPKPKQRRVQSSQSTITHAFDQHAPTSGKSQVAGSAGEQQVSGVVVVSLFVGDANEDVWVGEKLTESGSLKEARVKVCWYQRLSGASYVKEMIDFDKVALPLSYLIDWLID